MAKPFIRKAAKRPVDKVAICLFDAAVGTTQKAIILRTAAMAETFVGGHIQGTMQAVTSFAQLVIALVREGVTIPTISITDNTVILTPEEWIIWSHATVDSAASPGGPNDFSERIKTMRKLRKGDRIVILARSSTSNGLVLACNFTGFFKQ